MRNEPTNHRRAGRKNESAKMEKAASVKEDSKQTKQIIKSIIVTFKVNDSDSKTDKMSSTDFENETNTMDFANKPPQKTPNAIQ